MDAGNKPQRERTPTKKVQEMKDFEEAEKANKQAQQEAQPRKQAQHAMSPMAVHTPVKEGEFKKPPSKVPSVRTSKAPSRAEPAGPQTPLTTSSGRVIQKPKNLQDYQTEWVQQEQVQDPLDRSQVTQTLQDAAALLESANEAMRQKRTREQEAREEQNKGQESKKLKETIDRLNQELEEKNRELQSMKKLERENKDAQDRIQEKEDKLLECQKDFEFYVSGVKKGMLPVANRLDKIVHALGQEEEMYKDPKFEEWLVQALYNLHVTHGSTLLMIKGDGQDRFFEHSDILAKFNTIPEAPNTLCREILAKLAVKLCGNDDGILLVNFYNAIKNAHRDRFDELNQ